MEQNDPLGRTSGQEGTIELDDDPWDIHVDASNAARRYIRGHGGRVFVWLHPVTEDLVMQKVSTAAPPAGPLFDDFHVDGFTLFLDRTLDPLGDIRLRLHPWWPWQPLSLRTGFELSWPPPAPRPFADESVSPAERRWWGITTFAVTPVAAGVLLLGFVLDTIFVSPWGVGEVIFEVVELGMFVGVGLVLGWLSWRRGLSVVGAAMLCVSAWFMMVAWGIVLALVAYAVLSEVLGRTPCPLRSCS
jgi:hypothetical protein